MNANRTGKHDKAVWGGRVRRAAMLAAALLSAAALSACSDAVRSGQASSYLVMTSLTSKDGSTLSSDVRNDTTGGIAEDVGTASFQLNMKDVLASPTDNNSITLTQYHVEYVRADGHNVQGVDVPYAFDGGVTLTVTGSGSVGFTLVRIQAKKEAPLAAMANHGGQVAITTIAKVTFYGHDQTGREVSVTGNIEVKFDDWAG
jgi:Flp pilus assembly protein TadG